MMCKRLLSDLKTNIADSRVTDFRSDQKQNVTIYNTGLVKNKVPGTSLKKL
jgi:hypothetical protein